ncbi:MAG: short chain dehydrogenase [Proteobacteria bacterium ST_bin12]|nr:MAG: short chain dehydrogenase [Proteobacteria bacterium ST_bin12]
MNLRNKRILLTGATGGLGEQIGLMLAQKGAVLALVGRNQTKLNALKVTIEALDANAFTIQADLSEPHIASSVINQAKAYLGEIDVLINNAGVLDFIELQDQTDTRIAEVIQTNVTALIQLTRALLPSFQSKNQGHFVFVGSIFGSLGFPHFATYCASKFAVHGFSQALRRELVNTHIGVTYIAPRGIETDMNDANTVAMWAKTGNAMDSAEKVASIIVQALEKEKQEVFIGQPQTFFAWLNGVLPQVVNIGLKKQTALAAPFVKKT